MKIEILNTNVVNKGAHLMLVAITSYLRGNFPEAIICVRPHHRRLPFSECSRLGLRLKAPTQVAGFPLGGLQGLLPSNLREAYGLVREEDIDIFLDASGFAYSSQWGDAALRVMAKRVKRWKRHGRKVILLPQAYGPFKQPHHVRLMANIIENATLVFARDPESFHYLEQCAASLQNVVLAPDLTTDFLSEVEFAERTCEFDRTDKPVVLVPNARVVDKGAAQSRESYCKRLCEIARLVRQQGLTVAFLVHEGAGDAQLCERILQDLDFSCAVYHPTDPTQIKALLGQSRLVVASRFHALVSALSCGVPVIAMGWSHKYQCLLADYDWEQFLIGNDGALTTEEVATIRNLLADCVHNPALAKLAAARLREKARCQQMWQTVKQVIQEL